MARKPAIPPEQRLQMFLQTVNDHPWAAPRHVQALSGLYQREFYEARSRAREEGLVEQTCIRTQRNPPQRYALLPAGAQLLPALDTQSRRLDAGGAGLRGNLPPPLGALRDALLRALDLDLARRLLAKWAAAPGLIWARSPFTVHARDLRPLFRANRLWSQEMLQDRTYRSLRLEGLACLAFPAPTGRFLHVAIIVDPGDVTLSWFFHQFRSVYAWQRRPEFHTRAGAFPVFILLAANQTRLRQLTQLWRACARGGSKPAHLYTMTRHAVEEHSELEQGWRDERQRPTRLWVGAVGTESESHVPQQGSPPLTTSRALEVESNEPRSSRTYGLLKWVGKRQMPSAYLVRDHLHIGARGRELLDRIGRYPLLTSVELAAVLAVTPANVYPALGELAARGLIERPTAKLQQQGEGNGFALTGRGLTLLAAQAGFPTRLYAELRHWPLQVELTPLGKALTYSTDYLLARHAHARLVVVFGAPLQTREITPIHTS